MGDVVVMEVPYGRGHGGWMGQQNIIRLDHRRPLFISWFLLAAGYVILTMSLAKTNRSTNFYQIFKPALWDEACGVFPTHRPHLSRLRMVCMR